MHTTILGLAEQDTDRNPGETGDRQRVLAAHSDDGTVFHSQSVTIERFHVDE